MHEGFRGFTARLAAAIALHRLVEFAVDALAVLALVGEQRRFFLIADATHVHVIGGMKAHGLLAEVDFVIVQFESAARGQPGAKGQRTGSLVVQVRIDRPLRKQNVGIFGEDQLAQRFRGVAVHHGGAVDLAGEDRLGPQDPAGGLALGRSNGGGFVVRLARNARLSACEINDRDAGPQRRIARQRAATPGFGIVRMAARLNYVPRRKNQWSASLWEATRIALDSLRKNKLRSFLTLLGIILATTTLIAVTALIHGMDRYIADKVSNMGADGFRIVRMAWFGEWDPKKFFEMDKRNPQIRVDEYEFIRSKATLLKDIGMMTQRQARVAFKGNSVEGVTVNGITDNIPAINNVQVGIGRGITYDEVRRHMAVAFIGNDIFTRFFEGHDPLGKTISIEGDPYEVIGVAQALGSVFGQSQDNFVMIPVESYFKTYGARNGIRLVAKAMDQQHLVQAQDEVRVLLRSYRHLGPAQDDNFVIFASETFVTLWEQLTKTIAAMAVGVVSVFMVVGGIVIMNIMLAVVTERTREIGIRKSLGARRRDILNQYLVESAVLAGAGGLLGVGKAWLVAGGGRTLYSVPRSLPASSIAIGVGLSSVVGLCLCRLAAG